MPTITSIAARMSGVVAFSDNTVESFHTQREGALIWSQQQANSQECLRQVSWSGGIPWPFWAAIINAMSALGFMSFTWDTDHPTTQKTVTSMTGRFDFIVAFDDNTVATAAVVGEGTLSANVFGTLITADDARITAASNIATVRSQLESMCLEVMDTCTISA